MRTHILHTSRIGKHTPNALAAGPARLALAMESTAIDDIALGRVINHVFLPPRLPDREDQEHCGHDLLDLLTESLNEFEPLAPERAQTSVARARIAVANLRAVTPACAAIDDEKLKSLLLTLLRPSELSCHSSTTC